MKMHPVNFIWKEMSDPETGGLSMVMVPKPRYAATAASQFMAGEEYSLVVLETRSRASHNAFFAEVESKFKTLPETIDVRFKSPDHLRKWCLIERGWCVEKETFWDSRDDAMRHAAFVKEDVDEYARIHVHETMAGQFQVIVRHAMSQAAVPMGKREFEQSKKDVLNLIDGLLGIQTETPKKQAGRNG